MVGRVCAGALACWNHPFEVARIEAQARADQGQSSLSMPKVMSMVRLLALKVQGLEENLCSKPY